MRRIQTETTDLNDIEFWLLYENVGPRMVGGNKRYKLAPALQAAKQGGYKRILTFGGAYSNHIHALALSSSRFGIDSIGIIRGEPEYAHNPTLSDARRAGMRLEFVTRQEYRKRHDPRWLEQLQFRYPDALIIPEGGSTLEAARACAEMLDAVESRFLKSVDVLACAVGTGATFSGLHSRLVRGQQAIGFMVVQDETLSARMQRWIERLSDPDNRANGCLVAAHHPAYAKLSADQFEFIERFYATTNVLLDPVYTGKMLMRLMDLIARGSICAGSRILAVHTGGLQSWRGLLDDAGPQMSALIQRAIRRHELHRGDQ